MKINIDFLVETNNEQILLAMQMPRFLQDWWSWWWWWWTIVCSSNIAYTFAFVCVEYDRISLFPSLTSERQCRWSTITNFTSSHDRIWTLPPPCIWVYPSETARSIRRPRPNLMKLSGFVELVSLSILLKKFFQFRPIFTDIQLKYFYLL